MLRAGLVTALLVVSSVQAAQAQTAIYTFKEFGSANFSETLVAKNGAGTKLVQRQSSQGITDCVLVHGNKHTRIKDPGGVYTRCTGLGRNGGVVGYYGKNRFGAPYTGFTYVNGAYADVMPAAASPYWGSTLNAVSANGLIAGSYQASDDSYPIFLTYGTTYTLVQISGVEVLVPTAVNDQGVLVALELFGTMRGTQTSSVLIVDGVASNISFPGSVTTYAYGINNQRDVVGYYDDANYKRHGFIYSSTKNTYFGPIDVPGATATLLLSINDADVVTGTAVPAETNLAEAIIGTP